MRSTQLADISTLRSEISAHLNRHGTPDAETLEERCRSYLEELRWPEGVSCPRCEGSGRLLWLASRSKWHCYACRYQFSVTAATFFHQSHLPVWKWFVAVHLMVESPRGVSANELRQVMGGSYKTAWFASHRIRAAMRGSGAEILRNLVQAEREQQRAGELEPGHLLGEADRERLVLRRRVRQLLPGQAHNHLSGKYLHAYIDERRWRLSNQDNPHAFRDTILALLHGEGISYEQLIANH